MEHAQGPAIDRLQLIPLEPLVMPDRLQQAFGRMGAATLAQKKARFILRAPFRIKTWTETGHVRWFSGARPPKSRRDSQRFKFGQSGSGVPPLFLHSQEAGRLFHFVKAQSGGAGAMGQRGVRRPDHGVWKRHQASRGIRRAGYDRLVIIHSGAGGKRHQGGGGKACDNEFLHK